LIPASQRPILSKAIKGAVLKNIAIGNIREYIKTHEAIKDYEVLREEVLQMAMFNRTESNAQAQKPMPMDLNAVMEKLRDQLNNVKKPENDFNFGHGHPDGKGSHSSIADINQATPTNQVDQFITEINAMIKGKGKGKGVECFNCGKTGHYAKDCWSKGKGDAAGKGYPGKGYPGKGFTGKGYPSKGDSSGKGGPKGGCFNCGGQHWVSECPSKGKGKGKGVNGVDANTNGDINAGLGFPGLELGGGKGGEQAQVEWDYQQELYGNNWQESVEYDGHDWIKEMPPPTMINSTDNGDSEWTSVGKNFKKKAQKFKFTESFNSCCNEINCNSNCKTTDNVIMNVKGEWEKITFTGDSGAVDHVITKEAGKAFEVKPTPASIAGFGFRAANGTPIKIYGERKLNGVTTDGEAFKMSCQVTDVKKNLASFVKMVNEGNDIVMSKKGSFIKNVSNGKIIKLDLQKGTPQFDVWVKKANEMGQYGVLNVDGEADIKDHELSAFQRLEMHI